MAVLKQFLFNYDTYPAVTMASQCLTALSVICTAFIYSRNKRSFLLLHQCTTKVQRDWEGTQKKPVSAQGIEPTWPKLWLNADSFFHSNSWRQHY